MLYGSLSMINAEAECPCCKKILKANIDVKLVKNKGPRLKREFEMRLTKK